jgi:hypothetical protein
MKGINYFMDEKEKFKNDFLEKFENNSNSLFIIYPKDKDEESAEKLAGAIEAAIGIVKFDDGCWGVLVEKK